MPTALTVTAHADGCGPLHVSALTLRAGPSNTELYAALKNDGDTPVCSPAFSVELLDEAEQSLALAVGGALVRSFYRLADGSGTLAACAAPGDVTMVAIRDLPPGIAPGDVTRVAYWCNYWALSVTPVTGLTIDEVQAQLLDDGTAYSGVLVNGLDVGVSDPAVAIFPLNRVGRPLGVTFAQSTEQLPPAGSWRFQSGTVSDAGIDQAAYPAHGP